MLGICCPSTCIAGYSSEDSDLEPCPGENEVPLDDAGGEDKTLLKVIHNGPSRLKIPCGSLAVSVHKQVPQTGAGAVHVHCRGCNGLDSIRLLDSFMDDLAMVDANFTGLAPTSGMMVLCGLQSPSVGASRLSDKLCRTDWLWGTVRLPARSWSNSCGI